MVNDSSNLHLEKLQGLCRGQVCTPGPKGRRRGLGVWWETSDLRKSSHQPPEDDHNKLIFVSSKLGVNQRREKASEKQVLLRWENAFIMPVFSLTQLGQL